MGRPKQFIELRGKPALHYTMRAFEEAPEVARIYAVGDRRRIEALASEAGITKYARCAEPGGARSLSTRNGLLLCEEDPETVVLVHDGSRCLVTPDLIGRVAEAVHGGADGVVPAIPVSDTIKVAKGGAVSETLDRANLRAVQTPQAFRLGLLRRLHEVPEEYLLAATDDASLVEREGGRIDVVKGEKTNIKLTSPEDLVLAKAILGARENARGGAPMRIGLGVDAHAFAAPEDGHALVLGGVKIPSARGLIGHSDADVLTHAVTDALLGAAGLEDIGHYFPDTDERYKDAYSIELLREVRALVGASWQVANVDAVVICERPKIRDHREAMRTNLAGALGVEPSLVTVRGTTTERLGFAGRGEGIAAQAVCLLETR
jgi:2-C-methyl-D-erythritol 2,4-cyclodiphosphate synthase/2-C-methyl-D-erythritol 4-phosphate cytidylyltransferase